MDLGVPQLSGKGHEVPQAELAGVLLQAPEITVAAAGTADEGEPDGALQQPAQPVEDQQQVFLPLVLDDAPDKQDVEAILSLQRGGGGLARRAPPRIAVEQ